MTRSGTLFLDEVGDLPMALQVKLLRVLQERQVVRLGARHPIALNVRLVAATNVDLHLAVAAGRFRADLYYRLSAATATRPALPRRSACRASEGLAAARGDRVLFSSLSFALHGGEALWVRGANGGGKTTLLRLLCGLALSAAGHVRWCRQPIAEVRDYFHRHVLYAGHASGIKDDLLAWENLATAAAPAGLRCGRAQAGDALTRIGLCAQAPQRRSQLPGGARNHRSRARWPRPGHHASGEAFLRGAANLHRQTGRQP